MLAADSDLVNEVLVLVNGLFRGGEEVFDNVPEERKVVNKEFGNVNILNRLQQNLVFWCIELVLLL